jgi:hypothetical protein
MHGIDNPTETCPLEPFSPIMRERTMHTQLNPSIIKGPYAKLPMQLAYPDDHLRHENLQIATRILTLPAVCPYHRDVAFSA